MSRNRGKWNAPKSNPYGTVIQSAPAEETPKTPDGKEECYRFSLKTPLECKEYLQEMAWQKRISITEYISRLILEDMKQHPDWRKYLDELNK